jgi:hypothetical protein
MTDRLAAIQERLDAATRGTYPRCKTKPCKRKAERDGLCMLHWACRWPTKPGSET